MQGSQKMCTFAAAKRGVAQLVAFLVWDQAVAGSSPVTSTTLKIWPLIHNGLAVFLCFFLKSTIFRTEPKKEQHPEGCCSFLFSKKTVRYLTSRS